MVKLTIKIIILKQKLNKKSFYRLITNSLTNYKVNYPMNKENKTRDWKTTIITAKNVVR